MNLLECFFFLFLVIFIALMLFMWMWVLYYKINCRKVDSCANRKCRYWEWCSHNREERKRDEMEYRKQNLMRQYGLSEDDLK